MEQLSKLRRSTKYRRSSDTFDNVRLPHRQAVHLAQNSRLSTGKIGKIVEKTHKNIFDDTTSYSLFD